MKNLTKLSLMGGSLLWAWTRLKSDVQRLSEEVGGFGRKVAGEAYDYGTRGAETVSSSAQRLAKSAPTVLKSAKKQQEAIMGKPKKKFSFLKFLLIMGALVALAIFLLDKFLPKPYRDDELEDAWAGEDLEPSDDTPEAPAEDEASDDDDDEGDEEKDK
ncbi:hypothetical protein KQI52_03820 [bacterium]|nr:hypothetical protein [bacterium]